MDDRVEEEWVVEFGTVTGLFARDGLEAGGERFVPFDGERGYVGVDAVHLVGGDIAGKWDGVEAGAADRGVGEDAVDVVGRLGPALGEEFVFHDGDHEAGVADLFDGNGFDGSGDDAGGGERAARAEAGAGEGFDGGTNGDVAERRGGGVDAHVGPVCGGGDFVAYRVGYFGVDREGRDEIGSGGVDVTFIFGEDFADDVGSFKADGELSAGAVVPGAGEEGAVRFQQRGGSEVEGALCVRAVSRDVLDQFSGAGDGLPVDARVVGDDGAGVEVRQGGERALEQMHGGRIVGVVKHGWTDVGIDFFIYG